jgi:hypothetical protein
MASKKLSTDTSLANSYKLSRGVASVARPSAPTIGTATDGGSGNMSVTFTASTLGPTASSFSLTSSSGVTGSGASSPLTLQEAATGTYTYSVSGTNANGTGPSSAASNSVVVASLFAPSGAYDSIATVTVSSPVASIQFASIPQTYTHLELRWMYRSTDVANTLSQPYWYVNNSRPATYASHWSRASNTSALSTGAASAQEVLLQFGTGGGATASVFGAGINTILDYTNTNKNKTHRGIGGVDLNGSGQMVINSGLIPFTAAITQIDIFPDSGNFAQYCKFALYGIKGA